MLIRELLSEVKRPLTVVDLRYEEPSDPKQVLKHWGSEPKEYIHPQTGFFWHWGEGKLLLHSERNENYSWKMTQLLGLRDPKETKQPLGELWNQLNGKVDLKNRTITILKEYADSNKPRQRSISNIKELQDALKVLMRYGVTEDFKIAGTPPHVAKTVGQVLAQQDPTSMVLRGEAPVLYHGTSSDRWEQIQQQGLQPGHTGEVYSDLRPGYSEYNVYLATNPKIAEFYAKRQAKKDGSSSGVILKVTVPDPARLLSDDWWVPAGQWSEPEKRVIPPSRKEQMRRAGSQQAVSGSGRQLGSFAYRGRIPSSRIEMVRKVTVKS
jgi:hypothetical protein